MFEGIKAKSLDISKADYQELKKWEWDVEFYRIVKYTFQTSAYKCLSLEYKNRVYQALNQLQEMDLNYFDLEEALKTFWEFFRNWAKFLLLFRCFTGLSYISNYGCLFVCRISR